jgi:hypothetical protein
MRVKTITVSYQRKIGLPNFGSAGFSVEYGVELEPGEDVREVTRALHEEAREEVKRQALPLVRQANNRLDQVFPHLPEDLQAQIMRLMESE